MTLVFNASASSDPDGTISEYSWDFGDGQTAAGVSPTHTYAQAGSYTVDLTVKDNNNAFRKMRKIVNVMSANSPLTIISPLNNSESNVDLLTIEGIIPSNATKVLVKDSYGNERIGEINDKNFVIKFIYLKTGLNQLTVKAYDQLTLVSEKVLTVTKLDSAEASATVTISGGGALTVTNVDSPLYGASIIIPQNSSSHDEILSLDLTETSSVNETFDRKIVSEPFQIFPSDVVFSPSGELKIPFNALPSNISINILQVSAVSLLTGELEELVVTNRTSSYIKVSLPHTMYTGIVVHYREPVKQNELRIHTFPAGAAIHVNNIKVSSLGDVSLQETTSGPKTIRYFLQGYNEAVTEINFNALNGKIVEQVLVKSRSNKPIIIMDANLIDGMSVDENIYEVKGNASFNGNDLSDAVAVLKVNDQERMLSIDGGDFAELVSLSPGKNTIQVRVTPKNGDTQVTQNYVIYNEEFSKTVSYQKILQKNSNVKEMLHSDKTKLGGLTVSLTWSKKSDVDLHVFDPEGNHAWFGSKDGIPGGEIDIDDMEGTGPEIFTMLDPKAGRYKIKVHHFGDFGTGPALATLTAKLGGVTIFEESRMLADLESFYANIDVKVDFQIIAVKVSKDFAESNEPTQFTTQDGENQVVVNVQAMSEIADSDITYEVLDITDPLFPRNLNITSTGRSIIFNVDHPIPTMASFTPKNGKPLKYKITAKSLIHNKSDVFLLSQDVLSQVRQEYVDSRNMSGGKFPSTLRVPEYNEFKDESGFFSYSGSFKFNEFQTNDFTNTGKILLESSLTAAELARSKYGFPLRVTSAWRNPRRNFKVGGEASSQHQSGNGIDLTFIGNTGSFLPVEVLIAPRAERYKRWKEFMYKKLCTGPNALNLIYDVFSHGKDHIHLQVKRSNQGLGKCEDLD